MSSLRVLVGGLLIAPPCPTWRGQPVTWEKGWEPAAANGPVFICGGPKEHCPECGAELTGNEGYRTHGVTPEPGRVFAHRCMCGLITFLDPEHPDDGVTILCDRCDTSCAAGATDDEAVAALRAAGGRRDTDGDTCPPCAAVVPPAPAQLALFD